MSARQPEGYCFYTAYTSFRKMSQELNCKIQTTVRQDQQLINKYNEQNTQYAVERRFTVQLTTSKRERGREGENGG